MILTDFVPKFSALQIPQIIWVWTGSFFVVSGRGSMSGTLGWVMKGLPFEFELFEFCRRPCVDMLCRERIIMALVEPQQTVIANPHILKL